MPTSLLAELLAVCLTATLTGQSQPNVNHTTGIGTLIKNHDSSTSYKIRSVFNLPALSERDTIQGGNGGSGGNGGNGGTVTWRRRKRWVWTCECPRDDSSSSISPGNGWTISGGYGGAGGAGGDGGAVSSRSVSKTKRDSITGDGGYVAARANVSTRSRTISADETSSEVTSNPFTSSSESYEPDAFSRQDETGGAEKEKRSLSTAGGAGGNGGTGGNASSRSRSVTRNGQYFYPDVTPVPSETDTSAGNKRSQTIGGGAGGNGGDGGAGGNVSIRSSFVGLFDQATPNPIRN